MHCPRCGVLMIDDEISCTSCGYLDEIVEHKEPEVAEDELEPAGNQKTKPYYAGFWRRFMAIVLDLIFLTVAELIITAIFGGAIYGMTVIGKRVLDAQLIRAFSGGFIFVLAIAANWAYFTGFESSSRQATLGKTVMGILVADNKGKQISLGRANLRYWSKIISVLILFLGFMMTGFTKKKQALHDLIAGTILINKPAEEVIKNS